MKWKNDVIIEKKKNQYIFHLNQKKLQIEAKDCYICDAVEDGVTDDKELIQIIMEKEEENDVEASLRLAQFVLDYSEFISNDIGHMVIEP